MIRFVDLSDDYWTDPEYGHPICAFLCTSSDRFLETVDGEHTFNQADVDEYPDEGVRERMRSLTPDGFWSKEKG